MSARRSHDAPRAEDRIEELERELADVRGQLERAQMASSEDKAAYMRRLQHENDELRKRRRALEEEVSLLRPAYNRHRWQATRSDPLGMLRAIFDALWPRR